MQSVRRVQLFFLAIITVFLIDENTCCPVSNGKYDFSSLRGVFPVIDSQHPEKQYYISLCEPLKYESDVEKKECTGGSICAVSNGTSISLGDYSTELTASLSPVGNDRFILFFSSVKPCKNRNRASSSISFVCGRHIGSPVLITFDECQAYFYWETSAACEGPPKIKETRCYTYDDNNTKIDLSPLIKMSDGYSIQTTNPDTQLVINVCADILPGGVSKTCPDDTAACEISKDKSISFGRVNIGGLKYTKEGVLLEYGVTGQKNQCDRKTTILFRCPRRMKYKPPRIISSSSCHYEIEWETEYACAEHLLKSDLTSCRFTEDVHGIDIDLSPLRKQHDSYKVSVSRNGSQVDYYLNVCGEIDVSVCKNIQGFKYVSACMFDSKTSTSKVIGAKLDHDLKFADSTLTLMYEGFMQDGQPRQDTVINFICSENETKVQYVFSDNRTHIFEWRTKHACVKTNVHKPCFAMKHGQKIDIGRLSRPDGNSWLVGDRLSERSNDSAFFIDVCKVNVSSCPVGSSFCKRGLKQTQNLGVFVDPPYYDAISDSVVLEYENGDRCGNNVLWRTVIYFICKPGHLNGSPILTNKDEKNCTYEVEWYTAEACPLEVLTGQDCKIYDGRSGMNFDLSPLKEMVYVVEDDSYTFHIGVCGAIHDTPCNKSDLQKNASVCRVDKKATTSEIIGKINDTLMYRDGIVSLHYNYENISSNIIFMCDREAGTGSPLLSSVKGKDYEFHWYTDLVCEHESSVECSVRNPLTNEIYDLSSLSRSDSNWVVYENDSVELQKTYINVCRYLVPQANCSRNAAACIVQPKDDGRELAYRSNAGRLSSLELKNDGHLVALYSHGNPCTSFGYQANISTLIHFFCQKDLMFERGPRYLGKVGTCQYTYLWSTKAACPTGDLVAPNSCSLTDPENEFTFDLSSLSNNEKPYSFTSEDKAYQINICGPVRGGCLSDKGEVAEANVSVCEVNKNKTFLSSVATSTSYSLQYLKGEDLQLVYKPSSTTGMEVVIRFPCSVNSVSPELRFLRKDNKRFLLEMKTSLTCNTEHFQCNFVDGKGFEYDLSLLSNQDWVTSDSGLGLEHLSYRISFCQPLTQTLPNCAGAVAACLVNTTDPSTKGFSLGTQFEAPSVSADGSIRVSYTNGMECGKGIKSSASIELACSSQQGALTLVGVTPDCEYFFVLNTPAACPLKISQGFDCSVQEPISGYTFDLKPLRDLNTVITVGSYNYSLSVCKPLASSTGACKGAAACQTKTSDASFSKSLGLASSNITYKDGVITLKYNGGTGDCHKKHNRTTVIAFTCDHEATPRNSVPTFISEDNNCTYFFHWPTVYACPPFDLIDCATKDKDGHIIDLSPLALTDGNYYLKHPMDHNKTFVINVCRSVVHTNDSLCAYAAASCIVDANEADPMLHSMSLGRVQHSPYFDNGSLKLKYAFGSQCQQSKSTNFMTTIIDFTCDRDARFSKPEFLGNDGCTYYFDWATTHACYWSRPAITGNCSVADPFTGYLYNLSSLISNTSYDVKNKNHLYQINVCGPVHGTPCEKGMCQEELEGKSKRHWNIGQPNAHLQLKNGILYLNYSNGESCHKGQFNRSTLIQFHCGSGIGKPMFEHETSDCTYYFTWETELACHPLIQCAVKNGSEHYDLSALTRGPYTVAESTILSDNATYYISVCEPLGEIPGTVCPQHSSVCRVPKNGLAENLGVVDYPPFMDFKGFPNAIYINGDVCSTNSRDRMKSRIIFVCDPIELLGKPVLIEIDLTLCFYLFEWRTSIVCPGKSVQEKEQSCLYKDVGRGIYFDLSSLRHPDSYDEIKNDKNSSSYLINVCGTVSSAQLAKCGDSSVCYLRNDSVTDVRNYGLLSTQQFSYDGHRLILSVYNGDDCPSGNNGKRTAQIFFVCNPDAGTGHPVLRKEYSCLSVFIWETNLVCRNTHHQCVFNLEGDFYDLYLLSSLSHNWKTTDKQNKVYWLNLCRGIYQEEETSGCPPSSAVCMKDSDGSHLPLGMADKMKVKKHNASSLVLTYESHSSFPCDPLKSSNTSLTSTTRIVLNCGLTLGSPKFISGPDSSCFFDFVWDTSAACVGNTEEVKLDDNGGLFEKDLNYSLDLTPILNRSYNVSGMSSVNRYSYLINLGGILEKKQPSPNKNCVNAAVCQTDPTNGFNRDIGSLGTRKFYRRGSQLHLELTSLQRSCGKTANRSTSTVIILGCSTVGSSPGEPQFLYESGGCDYVFEWLTYTACIDFHRPDKNATSEKQWTEDSGHSSASSHKAAIVVSLLVLCCVALFVIFVLSKAERRTAAASKLRSCFSKVSVPRFRYRRGDMLTELQSDF